MRKSTPVCVIGIGSHGHDTVILQAAAFPFQYPRYEEAGEIFLSSHYIDIELKASSTASQRYHWRKGFEYFISTVPAIARSSPVGKVPTTASDSKFLVRIGRQCQPSHQSLLSRWMSTVRDLSRRIKHRLWYWMTTARRCKGQTRNKIAFTTCCGGRMRGVFQTDRLAPFLFLIFVCFSNEDEVWENTLS